jgi:hypothetical protein
MLTVNNYERTRRKVVVAGKSQLLSISAGQQVFIPVTFKGQAPDVKLKLIRGDAGFGDPGFS